MGKRHVSSLILACAILNVPSVNTYGENGMDGNADVRNAVAADMNVFPGDGSFETGNESWFGCRSVDTEAYDGKYSLELDGAVERNCRSRLYYNLLDKGRGYAFSFYAKASAPGTKINLGLNNLYYQTFIWKTFTIGESWQRYVIEIPEQDKAQDFYLDMILMSDAKIWIDAVQLQQGRKAGEYSRPEKISLGLGDTGAQVRLSRPFFRWPLHVECRSLHSCRGPA